jgi:hypothetical protein
MSRFIYRQLVTCSTFSRRRRLACCALLSRAGPAWLRQHLSSLLAFHLLPVPAIDAPDSGTVGSMARLRRVRRARTVAIIWHKGLRQLRYQKHIVHHIAANRHSKRPRKAPESATRCHTLARARRKLSRRAGDGAVKSEVKCGRESRKREGEANPFGWAAHRRGALPSGAPRCGGDAAESERTAGKRFRGKWTMSEGCETPSVTGAEPLKTSQNRSRETPAARN